RADTRIDEDPAIPGPQQETAKGEFEVAVLVEQVLVAGPRVAHPGPGERFSGRFGAVAVVDGLDLQRANLHEVTPAPAGVTKVRMPRPADISCIACSTSPRPP